ncbi:MAG: UDP-N-acetylmuramoyl-L-alanine--D-glutamate ligase [Magnetococcales bacterium]|nr:UDP-N-acetylmuramoyl-L-alanine--D-glutamate ligase [Magnetococcales bacterium]
MPICDLVNRRVGILGMGVEGSALLTALRRAGHDLPVHLFTERDFVPVAAQGPVVCWQGEGWAQGLAAVDVLVRSPGFAPTHPVRLLADDLGLPQTTPTNLYMEAVRQAGLPVVGITGSKGKSTTSTLLYQTLREAGLSVQLLGNIGVAALDHLEWVLAQRAVTVFELSSYQCADLTVGPSIAVLLNLFPEHMDWHGSVEAYYQAKLRIATTQRPGDLLRIDQRSVAWMERCRPVSVEEQIHLPSAFHFADGWFCRGAERLFSDGRMRLPGRHNRENSCAVLAVAELFGIGHEPLQRVLERFEGLPYRLADLGYHGGIRWINDAISTAPEATVVALQAFGAEVATLIAGGKDRGFDYTPLVEVLAGSAVCHLIVLPETGAVIAALVRQRGLPHIVVSEVVNLAAAVQRAVEVTPVGRIVLFSPGAPSYNQFANFEERGRALAALIGPADLV